MDEEGRDRIGMVARGGGKSGNIEKVRSRFYPFALLMLLFAFSIAASPQPIRMADRDTAVKTVNVGTTPVALVVNPLSGNVYVANRGSNNVTVIDGRGGSTTIVAAGWGPAALAVNPATNKIYVANIFSNNVTVINGADNLTSTLSVGDSPRTIAVNPFTNKIYVANEGSNTVSVIDGMSNTVSTVAVGPSPRYLAVNPVTNKIYVSARSGAIVTVIDGRDQTAATVNVGSGPEHVGIDPVTNTIYTVGSIFFTRINGVNNAAETFFFGAPTAIDVNAVTGRAYVVDAYGQVGIVSGTSNKIDFVDLSAPAPAIVVHPATDRVYVPVGGSEAFGVAVLNGAGAQVGFVPTTARAGSAALDTAANLVYVASETQNVVFVIDEGKFVRDMPTVTGRVTSATGAAVSGASLSLLDADGSFKTARTNPSGYYRFARVPAGTTMVSVKSKRHRFTTGVRCLNVSSTTGAVNFVAN
jgi:YVTN family beta-propeller protein